MGGLTPVHHKVLERFVLSVGCRFLRQRGSHRIYWRDDQVRPIVIPTYRQVPEFVIRNILRQLKIEVDEYVRMLERS